VRPVQGQCERARQWASVELDGELSSFERALLADHLSRCPDCRAFRASVAGFTAELREAPHEPFEGIAIGRMRRRFRLAQAPVAVAMAVAVIALGSILASVQLKGAAVGGLRPLPRTPAVSGPDTLNLRTLGALKRLHAASLSSPQRVVHGGHVVLDQ
jgi:predicted anti-sigma-YlaC factor YlaD